MSALSSTIAIFIGIGSIFLAAAGLLYLFIVSLRDHKEQERRITETNQKVNKLLTDAQMQADQIVKQAVAEAQRIVSDVHLLKEDSAKLVDSSLSQVANESISRFKKDAENFNLEYTEAFKKLRQEYATKADQTFTSVEQLTREEFDKKMNEEFEKVKEQIQVYRDTQFKKVDEEINKIIVQVVKEVLGRAISLQDHEKLVLDALEEAKKEGVFAG